MKKFFLLISVLVLALIANASKPTIIIDGDKSDWAEVPMLSEPGTWPMLKVLPAADAELGTNALVYMMENTADFDPTWKQYPKAFIDKDYDGTTNTIDAYWAFDAMGLEYSATTGVTVGEDWVSFPKAISTDNKVFELGFPATYVTDLDSKFSFAMYYNSGAWFCPDRSEPAVQAFSPKNGFMYKTRSFTTVAGTTTLTTANVFAHPSMGEIGEYVDFGLRDNGYDTIRWAAFPIELTAPAVYDVTTNVTTTNGWKFEFWLVDVETNEVVAHIDAPSSSLSSSATSYNFGAWDLTAVPAGKYMLKVKNRTAFSKVKLNSILLEYKGGAPVAIPGTLSFDDVILSDEAWIDKSGAVDSLLFTARGSEGHNSANFAKWKVQVTQAGAYDFTANVYRPDGSQKYEIVVLNSDESSELISNSLTGMPTGNASISSGCVYLKEGVYTVKIRNTYDHAKSRLLSVVATRIGGAVQNMPGTTNINDAWFSANGTRADGKISYTNVADGCWAKWNIALANAGNYSVTVNICGQYGHNYSVEFLKEGETTPIVVTKNVINYTNNVTLYANELGNVELEAGNYEVKVSNAVGDASLLSLKLTYKGGAIIDIPGSIALNEAILTSRAFIDGDGLHFADADNLGHISEEYAKWNIHVAADGMYKFTANCNTYGTSYSNLTIQVLEGGEEKYTYTPQYTYTGAKEIKSPEWFLEAGNYELKLSNPANHSNGYLVSLSAAAVEGILIVDEMATDMQNIIDLNGQSRKPLFKRSFKGGMYNTVLFPFKNMTDAELTNIFGEGYELIELTSASLEGSVLNLNFSPVDLSQDTYGRPYLIRPTKDVTNPLFNSHTIYKSTSHLVKSCDAVDFVGSFIKSEVPAGENNLFLGQNNMLYFSQTATPIKGTRAYFRVNVPGGANMVKAARIVTSQNATTDINLVEQGVQTQKIMENGQLFIIKNGVKYNAMGQMVK